jgi:hypothetical protein
MKRIVTIIIFLMPCMWCKAQDFIIKINGDTIPARVKKNEYSVITYTVPPSMEELKMRVEAVAFYSLDSVMYNRWGEKLLKQPGNEFTVKPTSNSLITTQLSDSIKIANLESNIAIIQNNLSKCYDQYRIGTGLIICGTAVTITGSLIKPSATKDATGETYDYTLKNAVMIGGGVIAFIGWIIQVDSHKYIGRASNHIKIKSNGISYNF